MGRIERYRSLPLGDKLRLVAGGALLLVVWGTVVALPFATVRKALVSAGAWAARIVTSSASPARVAWAVDIADRNVPGDRTCLVRSLSAETLLRAHGYRPEHRIGVARTESGEIEAHSWIEFGGDIVIGGLADLDRYEPLPPLDEGIDQ
jgi:hypothetical protein